MTLWLTESEADAYFETRLGASDFWATGTEKTAALTTAQNFIESSGLFSLPTAATAVMRNAVCEQALFLLMHNTDRRVGLQAQGVTWAGVIKEKYGGEVNIPICPMAAEMLSDYATAGAGIVGLERDEEEDVR